MQALSAAEGSLHRMGRSIQAPYLMEVLETVKNHATFTGIESAEPLTIVQGGTMTPCNPTGWAAALG